MKKKNTKKDIKKLLDSFDITNRTCWRCGKKFYHSSLDICSKCSKEIKNIDE